MRQLDTYRAALADFCAQAAPGPNPRVMARVMRRRSGDLLCVTIASPLGSAERPSDMHDWHEAAILFAEDYDWRGAMSVVVVRE